MILSCHSFPFLLLMLYLEISFLLECFLFNFSLNRNHCCWSFLWLRGSFFCGRHPRSDPICTCFIYSTWFCFVFFYIWEAENLNSNISHPRIFNTHLLSNSPNWTHSFGVFWLAYIKVIFFLFIVFNMKLVHMAFRKFSGLYYYDTRVVNE